MARNDSYSNTPRSSSGNGGIYFVLGAIVVAIGVIIYLVAGGDADLTSGTEAPSSVNITNEAPDGADAGLTIDTDDGAAVTTDEEGTVAPEPAPEPAPAPVPPAE
ncbi:hypothetical protein [Celeribacter indicus]|uniref:Uncharacterized protein n=1 Tax=Celeribacter indicus TaxID=1208324 RepID=A0A0B5DVJ4_9RHOB|nr:hypothetical protein [Celeribacter indicus]AJE45175.1 hypothetical protein P73_0460 [Celeribacter indicus]SDX25771.1 hypothetical protein SAMN05443573_1197 [Celeribacter indicus]